MLPSTIWYRREGDREKKKIGKKNKDIRRSQIEMSQHKEAVSQEGISRKEELGQEGQASWPLHDRVQGSGGSIFANPSIGLHG